MMKRQRNFYFIFLFLLLGISTLAAHANDIEKNKENTLSYFLTLADIHFDPFISCQTTKVQPCPLIVKLNRAPVNEWSMLLAAYDKSVPVYRQDTDYSLLVSSLTAAKKAAASEHAQFVIVLGDLLGHNFKHYYKKYSQDQTAAGRLVFTRKTIQFVTNELAKTFPQTNVYMLVGNNDSYQNDYVTPPNSLFLKEAASEWSALIKNKMQREEMQQTFPYAGYYAINLSPDAKLRLIVLNTVLFSVKAKGKNVDQAADNELKWLQQQLASVKAHQQKAIIAMHIPPGVDVYATLRLRLFTLVSLWKPAYAARFQTELQQFAPVISGIFSGHLHSDWFQVLTFNQSTNEIPITGTPSISPIFGNNPGFKIYSYSPTSLQLDDFVTYYYSLSDKRTWGLEYDFNHIYQANCHDCIMIHGMDALAQTGELAAHYRQFYAVNMLDRQSIVSQWQPYYWCAIHEVDVNRYKKCVNVQGR